MYGDEETTVKPKSKVGDKVRIGKARRVFDKSYLPNWTEEIFTVTEALRTVHVTYKLKDYGDEELLGGFYEHELQPVTKTDENRKDIEDKTVARYKRVLRQMEGLSRKV